MIFFQILINGLIAGAIYALVASGFSLIYSTNKFVNFAHGGVIAVSAYIMYWLSVELRLNTWLAMLLTIILGTILGYFLNKLVYGPLRARKASNAVLLVSSLSLLIMLEAFMLLIFGAGVKTIDLNLLATFDLAGVSITLSQVIIIIFSLVLFILLFLFTKKTKLGKSMRAVESNKDMAEILGISATKIYSWTFILGSAIASMAAILIAQEQNIEPAMGTSLVIKGFAASIIGGIGSIPGAILGAFILGLAENFGIWYLPSGYKDAIAFFILFIFLIFMPKGLLGKKKRL